METVAVIMILIALIFLPTIIYEIMVIRELFKDMTEEEIKEILKEWRRE